jgi:hypothetical protein
MPRSAGNTRGPKWKGPPGLNAREKKIWSEQQRQANLTAAQRQHQNALRRKNWPAKAERRAARRFRSRRAVNFQREEGLAIATRATLERPPLTYIDATGRLWQEDFRSAEQLIADWQREQKTRKKKGGPTSP